MFPEDEHSSEETTNGMSNVLFYIACIFILDQ